MKCFGQYLKIKAPTTDADVLKLTVLLNRHLNAYLGVTNTRQLKRPQGHAEVNQLIAWCIFLLLFFGKDVFWTLPKRRCLYSLPFQLSPPPS